MEDPHYKDQIHDLSKKIDSLILGYKIGGLALLFLASLLNLGTNFVIPRFGQIYKDALGPDHPLPPLTDFILSFQTMVTCLALLWPLLGIFAAFRFPKISHVTMILTCLLLIVIAQITLTWLGLYMPMVVISDMGMSDTR